MDKKSSEKEYYESKDLWDLSNFNKAHFKRVKKVLENIPKDSKSLLDVGCGNGILCNQAQIQMRDLTRVVGFDQSIEAMKQVRTEKKVGDITNLPFKEKEFDTVCCLEVLEHIQSDIFQDVIEELTRVGKRNIIITVPHNENLGDNEIQCPKCKTIFHRYLHVQAFNSNRLEKLFEKYGFTCRSINPIISYRKKIGLQKILKMSGRKPQQFFGNMICPYCKYSNKKALKKSDRRGLELKQVIDRLWPTKNEFKWFLAVYERRLH